VRLIVGEGSKIQSINVGGTHDEGRNTNRKKNEMWGEKKNRMPSIVSRQEWRQGKGGGAVIKKNGNSGPCTKRKINSATSVEKDWGRNYTGYPSL